MGHAHMDPLPMPEKSPQKVNYNAPPPLDYRRGVQSQPGFALDNQIELAQVPHNEYPTDGMTMFCRTDGQSERGSSVNSPVRPSSRDSQSDYSNPTSFSSIEPTSGKASPTKQDPTSQPVSPHKQIAKKRSGFFSNSPFRRKSKHEKDDNLTPRANQTNRNTWNNSRNPASSNPSPTRPGIASRDFAQPPSPEPVDPRANFQLNVGPNVFDVASPDAHRKPPGSVAQIQSQLDGLDPIAQALADLKGVTKQSSTRVSADRYHGIATPAPPTTPGGQPISSNSAVAAAQRGTPPPGYHDQQQSVSRRLDAPQPAHTSRAMQETTRRFVGQNADIYGSSNNRPGTSSGRPASRNGAGGIPPRAASPLPLRSASPRPGFGQQGSQQGGPPQMSNGYGRASPQPPMSNDYGRGASPNPYARQNGVQSLGNSPVKQYPPQQQQQQQQQQQYSSRHTSPNDIRRAASPQPQFSRPGPAQHERPGSSMALQIADPGQAQYGGSQRGRNGPAGGGGVGRPLSYYGGAAAQNGMVPAQPQQQQVRTRSKSVVDGRQFTRDGRPIMYFCESFQHPFITSISRG